METIKAQWHSGMDGQVARARSDWLLEQLDVRQWAHRYNVDGHPEVPEVRYRGQILSLAMMSVGVPKEVKVNYWQWFQGALLKQVQDHERELYGAVVQQVRAAIDDASKSNQNGNNNAR